MRGRAWQWIGTVVVVAALPGCRSVKGRYVDPQALRHGEDVGGAPVVVERPRYLKVTFKRTTMAVYALESVTAKATTPLPAEDDGGKPPKAGPSVTSTVRQIETHDVDEISTDIVNVGEVYAIDLMRPFSGTADHSLEMMDASGHLKSLHAKVDDQTFKDVLTNLPDIQTFIKGFGGKKDGAATADTTTKAEADVKVVPIGTRVLQIQIFDLQDIARGVYRPVMVLPSPAGLCSPPCPVPAPAPCGVGPR